MRKEIWLALVVICLPSSQSVKNCYVAQKNCRKDLLCTFAEYNYFHSCKSVLKPSWKGGIYNFSTYSCPDQCLYAINNLTADPLGKEMENCDCEMDANCLTLKARTRRCLAASKQELKNKTGCTAARAKCLQDPLCIMAERNFLLKCSQMISGVKCSHECLKSQEELFSLENAKILKTCECDGFGEPYCHGIRAHAEQLCSKPKTNPTLTQKDEVVLAAYSGVRTHVFCPFILATLGLMAGDFVV